MADTKINDHFKFNSVSSQLLAVLNYQHCSMCILNDKMTDSLSKIYVKRPLLCYLCLLSVIRTIFNENIIGSNKKVTYMKLIQKASPPFRHSSPLPLTSQSDKHHREPLFQFTSTAHYIFYTLIYLHTATLFQKFITLPWYIQYE